MHVGVETNWVNPINHQNGWFWHGAAKDLKEVYFMEKGRLKHNALVALSIGSLVIGALGIADVGFFVSNNGLGLIQIAMGVIGLIIAVR